MPSSPKSSPPSREIAGKVFELRAIHYSERFSEETLMYDAKLYIDGKFFAEVRNGGQGGPDDQWPTAGYTMEDVRRMNAWIEAHAPPDTSLGAPLPQSLESICQDLVEDWLAERDYKRLMKQTAYIVGKDLFTIKGEGDLRAVVLKKRPSAIFLKDLPKERVLRFLKEGTLS